MTNPAANAVVLRARLAMLDQSLGDVVDVLASIDRAHSGIQKLAAVFKPTGPQNDFAVSNGMLDTAMAEVADLNGVSDDDRKRILETLARAKQKVSDAAEQVFSVGARETVRNLVDRYTYASSKDLNDTINDFLVSEAKEYRVRIAGIQRSIDGEGVTAEAVSAAWQSYFAELPNLRKLFAEYVDFLAGVALRDAGYDDGICAMADEMVRAYAHVRDLSWKSVTIPNREELWDATLARVVRLGFPEWSLWTIPLSAFVWASIVISCETKTNQFIEGLPKAQRQVSRVLLADAIATATMGPAYACALLILRLDPANGSGSQRALARMRAETVLETLRYMSGETNDRAYDGVERELREHWEHVIAQLPPSGNGSPRPPAPAIATLAAKGAERSYGERMEDGDWGRVADWAQRLNGISALESAPVQAFDTPQHVLNAAWLARLNNPHADLADVEERATKLWSRVKAASTQRGVATVGAIGRVDRSSG
jgi:hypothetical protein